MEPHQQNKQASKIEPETWGKKGKVVKEHV